MTNGFIGRPTRLTIGLRKSATGSLRSLVSPSQPGYVSPMIAVRRDDEVSRMQTSMSSLFSDPPVVFSAWTCWSDRSKLRTLDGQPVMGVYMLAQFSSPPGPEMAPYPNPAEQVIYVGETNDLNGRPLSGASHDALKKYRLLFPSDSS